MCWQQRAMLKQQEKASRTHPLKHKSASLRLHGDLDYIPRLLVAESTDRFFWFKKIET